MKMALGYISSHLFATRSRIEHTPDTSLEIIQRHVHGRRHQLADQIAT